jgi:aconitase A
MARAVATMKMMRGTFANIRIKNEMVPGIEGGFSRYGEEVGAVYDVAEAQGRRHAAGRDRGQGIWHRLVA